MAIIRKVRLLLRVWLNFPGADEISLGSCPCFWPWSEAYGTHLRKRAARGCIFRRLRWLPLTLQEEIWREMTMNSAKNAIRARAKKNRENYVRNLSEQEQSKLSELIFKNFISQINFSPSDIVAGYWPTSHEANIKPILEYLAAKGQKLCLPVVKGPGIPLIFRHWSPGDPLKEGSFNVMEPLSSVPLLVPTHLLVPLISFDNRGHRLGYGAGHYDRTLKDLRKRAATVAIGISFEAQYVNELPVSKTDEQLDIIITEHRAHVFGTHPL